MTDKLPLVVDPELKQLREISAGEQLPAEILANALMLALTGLATADSGVVTATDNLLQAIGKVQGQLNNKVAKDGAKVLSDNNFTNAERVKLANIAEQATKNATDAALRDRSTHTGEQAISSVAGLQLALDSKETPAGALAQMRSLGLGASYLTYITNADGHRVSGKFALSSADSAAVGLPFPGIHIISYNPGNSNSNGEMWATAVSSSTVNGGRIWFRKLNADVWQPWKELAFLESPRFTGTPSAPNIKLENTASSDVNTLDHYEEGVFTPIIYGTTTAGSPVVSTRSGSYTRIGNRVNFNLRIAVTSLGGADGDLRISGLPFIVANIAANGSGANITFAAPFPANKSPACILGLASSSVFLYARDTTSTATTTLQASDLASINIYINGSYTV